MLKLVLRNLWIPGSSHTPLSVMCTCHVSEILRLVESSEPEKVKSASGAPEKHEKNHMPLGIRGVRLRRPTQKLRVDEPRFCFAASASSF